MTDLKETLLKLHKNLQILREREAKYGGNTPLDLLNQITDHQQAITLTEQAIRDEITETKWRESVRPLLVNIRDRSESQPETCAVNIGDVEGGIIGSIIAGGDVSNVQIAHGTNIAQASNGGHAEVNVSTFDQRGQQVNGDQYNADNMTVNQTAKESPAWRAWTVFLGIVTIIGVIIALFTVPQFNALVFPDPTPTPTPLAFTPAAEGESLILIATFHETGANKTEPHVKIKRAIQDAAKEVGLAALRVEIEPTILTADQREEAEALGKQYNAEMVIWGEDTGVQVLVNFYNLKQPNFDAADVKISEEQRTQLINPSAYAEFILRDLPGQQTFLALFSVGQTFLIREQYEKAIKIIETGISALNDETKPEGLAEAYFQLGWSYQRLGNQEIAKTYYTTSIELFPSAVSYNNLGLIYYSLNDYDTAMIHYNHAIELTPMGWTYNNRGLIYYDLGNYNLALVDFNYAIELNPENASVYSNRGNIYKNLGQYDEALADYNRAIELNPEQAAFYSNRGSVYTDILGQYEKALVDFDQAIKLNPKYADAYHNRGLTYYHLEQYNQSLDDYNQAIALNSKEADFLVSRGNTYFNIKEYDAAINDYNAAIKLDPEYAMAFYDRGNIYSIFKQYDLALSDYNQAILLNPKDSLAYYNRGVVHVIQGELENAIRDFESGLKFDRNPTTRQQAEEMLTRTKAILAKQ